MKEYPKSISKVKLVKKPDIVTVLEREGVSLKPRGNKLWAICPFHNETRPSFNVSVEKQVFYCFGCRAGGDVIKFVMAFKGFSYSQALRYLAIGKHGIGTVRSPISREQELIKRFRQWEKDYYEELIANLHATMNMKKQIVSPEDMEKFGGIFDEIQKTEYHLDILFDGDDEDKFNLFKEKIL